METLVHKSSVADRNLSGNTSSHVQYSSISNTNIPAAVASTVQVTSAPQVIVAQPAPISKPAKPVRDSAQFVSETKRFSVEKTRVISFNSFSGRFGLCSSFSCCLYCI